MKFKTHPDENIVYCNAIKYLSLFGNKIIIKCNKILQTNRYNQFLSLKVTPDRLLIQRMHSKFHSIYQKSLAWKK